MIAARQLFLLAVLAIVACSSADKAGVAVKADEEPAVVAPIAGSELKSVTLSARAAERLGIASQLVSEVPASGGHPAARAIPLAAIVYDTRGDAWVFAVTPPRTYLRRALKVARVQGDLAVLESGPDAGTAVVTVGAAELFGAEVGVGVG